jgi:hypothetical protein
MRAINRVSNHIPWRQPFWFEMLTTQPEERPVAPRSLLRRCVRLVLNPLAEFPNWAVLPSLILLRYRLVTAGSVADPITSIGIWSTWCSISRRTHRDLLSRKPTIRSLPERFKRQCQRVQHTRESIGAYAQLPYLRRPQLGLIPLGSFQKAVIS